MKDVQPTYEMLEVKSLKIANYQRIASNVQVKNIVKNFNPKLLGVVKVSYDDGIYNLIDGQHRVLALKILKISFCMCEVHRGLSYQQEAELFSKQSQNRRGLTSGEVFKAKVESQDSYSIDLKNIVEATGFKLSYHGGKSKNQISAIGSLDKICKQKNGTFVLYRTLSLIFACWDGQENATDAKMLQGVAVFIKEFEDKFDDKIFIKKLSKVLPKVIIREGSSDISKDQSKNGLNKNNKYKEIIRNYYNKGNSKRI